MSNHKPVWGGGREGYSTMSLNDTRGGRGSKIVQKMSRIIWMAPYYLLVAVSFIIQDENFRQSLANSFKKASVQMTCKYLNVKSFHLIIC
jgi:hypothetical protein